MSWGVLEVAARRFAEVIEFELVQIKDFENLSFIKPASQHEKSVNARVVLTI